MPKPRQQKVEQGIKLHNRVISELEFCYPILTATLHILLVHSIQEPLYLETVKEIHNFIQNNLEKKENLPIQVKRSIAGNLREVLMQAADEICCVINSRYVGFSVSFEKFKTLFKFLNSECEYEFLDIKFGISPEYFLERILYSKNSYRNYCAKKCKGININDIKYNPGRVEEQTRYIAYQYLANICYKLLTRGVLRDNEIEKLFNIPIFLGLNQEQEQYFQKNILNDAVGVFRLFSSMDGLQKFVDIVVLHPVCLKNYPFLLKVKSALLEKYYTEFTVEEYPTEFIDLLSCGKVRILKELIVDIKNIIDKIPVQERDLYFVTLASDISEILANAYLEKHSGNIYFDNYAYLELKIASLEISSHKVLLPKDALPIASMLFSYFVADQLISSNRIELLEKCINWLDPLLLESSASSVCVEPLEGFDKNGLQHGRESIEKDKLVNWFILNYQIQESSDEKILDLYQNQTSKILESLSQSSLLFAFIREAFISSQAQYYIYNNNIIKMQSLLKEHESSPLNVCDFLDRIKLNLVRTILEKQEFETVDPSVYSIVDSICITSVTELSEKLGLECSMYSIYKVLSSRTTDQNKAIEYFDKASEKLCVLNKLLESQILLNTVLIEENQSMVIWAIKYGRDYQEYLDYLDKASSIVDNKSLTSYIRKFKTLISDVEKYKDQIDFAALISKVMQNNSISKLSKALRDEFREEVAESKFLPEQLEEKEGALSSLVEPVKKFSISSEVSQQQEAVTEVAETIQREVTGSEVMTSAVPLTQLQEQTLPSVTIDYHAIAIKAKSDEIAHYFQQIFQKSKEAAKKAIWHEVIPSWSIDGQKYTSASPEIVGIWDNIYAIIFPKLLSNMPSKIRELCENAFYKGCAQRFAGSNGFKLIEKLVWELKCNADIRWAVKSKNIDAITKSVLLIVDHQTDHQGIRKLVQLKRTGKTVDTITYSNLSSKDEGEKISQADYDLGYDNVDICDPIEGDIEMFLAGGSAGGYG